MRWAIAILALILLAWLVASLLPTDIGLDDVTAGRAAIDEPADQTGSRDVPEATEPGKATSERKVVADGRRMRARVVTPDGEPVQRFWFGVLPQTGGSVRYSAPPLPLLGTIHELRDSLLAHDGVREVQTPDGWFDFEGFEDDTGALFVFAMHRAVLFTVGAPFGPEPVFVLAPPELRRIRVLDHEDESPVAEAGLKIRAARDFDFTRKLRSVLGSAGLRLPRRAAAGPKSGADGLFEVPLLVRVALYDRAPRPVYVGSYLPDELTVEKPGYVHGEVLWEHLATPKEHVVYLDGASATLRVHVVGADDRPLLAGLLFESRARRDIELGCFTDGRGQCELRDLPAGKTLVRIFVPERRPDPLRSGVLLSEQVVRASGQNETDTRELDLVPGRLNVLEHRMGTEERREAPKAWLHGKIRRTSPKDVIMVNVHSGEIRLSRGLRGDEYEQVLTPGARSTVKVDHHTLGLTETFELEPLGVGEKRKLDITPPNTDHLVRFRGTLAVEEGAKAWLPDEVHVRLLEGRADLPRTEEKTLFDKTSQLKTGAEFDIELAPGRYRVYGNYRPNPRFTAWNWFTLLDIEVIRDAEDIRITIPVVARFRVAPKDIDGKPVKLTFGRFASLVRSTDRPDTLRHHVMLRRGRYELVFLAHGSTPVRSNFEVRGSDEVVVPVTLSPGRGAVLKGRIFTAGGARPIARPINIVCRHTGLNHALMYTEARMGRFEFSGLVEGDYTLTVKDEEIAGGSHDFRFAIQAGQVRDDLVLRLPRRK